MAELAEYEEAYRDAMAKIAQAADVPFRFLYKPWLYPDSNPFPRFSFLRWARHRTWLHRRRRWP